MVGVFEETVQGRCSSKLLQSQRGCENGPGGHPWKEPKSEMLIRFRSGETVSNVMS